MPKMHTKAQRVWEKRRARADGLLAKLYGKGWTDSEIASAIGASFNTIYRWRNGEATPQGARLGALEKLVAGVEDGTIARPKPLVA